MKEISELYLPDDVRYSETHEWVRIDDDTVRIGISDYAQDQLGDIVFVELPKVGDTFAAGEEFGTVESVKAVSELYIPVGGEVVSINVDLDDSPELVNNDPYHDGWLIDVRPDNISEAEICMTKDDYMEILAGVE
ncbi:MAG: glycine cleavage system protein GcvH [Deltaproteobacteria bacterium]|nr:glycine cleavage system protein GcvH [Deltaproteobacteria bacterium]